MLSTVAMPLWLLILILAFAAVTFASHFLFPSVRWFFRRRMERVVAKLNERLERPIQPFKLARRHDTIQRLIYDPSVFEAVTEYAVENDVREDVAFEQARRYAREIVPSFSATAYFGFAIKIARWLSRAFYRVRIGQLDEAAMAGIDPDATIVFVMNHRSNMDYVLVTYLAADRSALSYAVGEWARVWPLSVLIRAMGAYFIRRNSRNALYRRILARYVQMATENGVMQAIFPEGGLSLDGTVGQPKLGLLSYIVADFHPENGRDVVFVPVALNYDRVLEDSILVAAQGKRDRRFKFRIRTAVKYISRHLWQRLTGRFLRFGYASVSYGAPLSLREFSKGTKRDLTKATGSELMRRIRGIVPVLPVPMLATIILRAGGAIDRAELLAGMQGLSEDLKARGIDVHLPRGDVEYALQVAMSDLLERRLLHVDGGAYLVTPENQAILQYYANSIKHHLKT